MNCYAVNEADNGPVHRDYSQVLRSATRFDEPFLSFRFRGRRRRRRVKVAEGCFHPRDNAGARRNRSVVRPRLSPVKHSNVSIKQPLPPPFILPIPQNGATHLNVCLSIRRLPADNCTVTADNLRRCDAQMLEKTRKRYFLFLIFSLKSSFYESNDFFLFIYICYTYIYITYII